jgi:hypothetical protein
MDIDMTLPDTARHSLVNICTLRIHLSNDWRSRTFRLIGRLLCYIDDVLRQQMLPQ